MAGVFHVEFGINDTALTQALEATNYPEAERLIKNRTVASYLDEGCYQRIPLFIVLCGQNEEMTMDLPRNLYLARLLIEYGASVNYRVPETFLGCEYLGPGKTALCLLVDFHIRISNTAMLQQGTEDIEHANAEDELKFYPHTAMVVGLNKQLLYNSQDILDDIEDLIFTLLSNGADPNLMDSKRRTCLHTIVSSGQRLELLKVLADNGANINALDNSLNTPLLSLCDTSDIHDITLCEFHGNCCDCHAAEEAFIPMVVKPDFLQYFLSRKDTEINALNNWSQTALFHCVLRGDTEACLNLLQAGADPSIKSMVWLIDDDDVTSFRLFSPLWVSFLSAPLQRSLNWAKDKGERRVETLRRFSHLVDAGYFSTKEITDELMTIIERAFPQFTHFRSMGSQLIHQVAGGTTATLKQLAARTIFKRTLMDKYSREKCEFSCDKFEVVIDNDLNAYEDYIHSLLNRDGLQKLISSLSLPRNALINFEIELFLHCLSIYVGNCQPIPPYYVDSSSVEGDSDLEYW